MDCVEQTTVKTEVDDNIYIDGNNDNDNTNDPFNNSSDESICNYNSDNDPFKEDEEHQLKNEEPFEEVNNTKIDKIPQEGHILNESVVKETSSTVATLKDYIDLPNYEYGCKHCNYVTKIRPYVFKHIRNRHMNWKKPIKQCPHCPYKTHYSLKYHLIARHKKDSEVEWYECHQCGYKGKLKSAFVTHLRSHKTYEEKMGSMIKCKHCPKMFEMEHVLRKHISRVHDKNKPDAVRCHLCGQEYCNKLSLNKHFKRFHVSDENLEMRSCDKCSYKTKFEQKLKTHLKQHVKRFQCEKCPYQTVTLEVMKLHEISHQKVKNEKDLKYRCDKCEYKTYRAYSFKVHKLNHLKPEKIEYFFCYHCEFKAKRKDNLKAHIKRHFKKKTAFVCYICDFKMNSKVSYIAHLDKHSKEQNKKQNSSENTENAPLKRRKIWKNDEDEPDKRDNIDNNDPVPPESTCVNKKSDHTMTMRDKTKRTALTPS